MANTLITLTAELGKVLSLLDEVLQGSVQVKALINGLGWELPPGVEDIGLAGIDLAAFLENLRVSLESSEEEWEDEILMADRITDLAIAMSDLVEAIHHLAQELPAQLTEYGDYVSRTNIHKELPRRIFDLLITNYLSDKSFLLFSILHLLNIIEFKHFEADHENYQVEHVRAIVHYDHMHSLFSDPYGHMQEAYGWGTPEFSDLELLNRISWVLQAMGAAVKLQPMDRRAEEALMGRPVSDTETEPAPQLIINLYEELGEIAGLMLGLSVFGARPSSRGASDGGIGFLPILRGQAAGAIPLYAFADTVFEFSADADLLSRIALILRPNLPLQIRTASSLGDLADGRFALGIRHGQAGSQAKTLVSFAGGSRLSMQQFTLMGGIEKFSGSSSESFVELGLWGCQVTFSLAEADGFLSGTIARDKVGAPFDFRLVWNSRKGIYFYGSTGLGVTIPLHLNLGSIFLESLHLALDTKEEGFEVEASATGSLTLGPLAVIIDRLGMDIAVSFNGGHLGLFDLSPRFKPPTGIGLSIDTEGITGGGFLGIDPPNYAGMMQLSFKNEIELTAFGLITTKLPDGHDGFSIIIQIMAEFQPMQIGLGFALTGVGGLIGINRQINEDGLKAAFKTHSLDAILFPQSPIRDAVKIIGALQSIMPPREGYHILGPMAKLFWGGSMRLIEFEVGVFIQLGGPLKIAILGRAWSHLPRGDSPRLVINVDVLGILDLGEERLAIDAVLYNSRILKFTLDGKMALRADWSSGEENFALSVGGFHPRFQAIPPGFPQLSRLLVAVGSDNPKLTLSLYLAITPNTLQIGAHVDLWAKKLGLTITGGAGFDALFTFSPFSFLIVFNVWVNVRGWIDLGVWLELELSGPNPIVAAGYAKFKIGWFTKKIRFRKEFGEKIPEPLPAVSPLAALIAELGHPRSIRFQLPAWASANLVFTKDAEAKIDPIADVIIIQNAVPLNFTLERFGGGAPPETEQRLSLTANLDADREKAVQSLFAPEQFKNWTADERLSARPFEKYDAGIRFSGEYVIPEDHLEEREIVFETVLRESKTYREQLPKSDYRNIAVRTTCLWQPEVVLLANWSLFGSQSYYKPLRKGRDESHPNYVKVAEPGFNLSMNEAVDGKFVSAAHDGVGEGQMTYAEALEVSKQIKDAQILIRSKVDMMPT